MQCYSAREMSCSNTLIYLHSQGLQTSSSGKLYNVLSAAIGMNGPRIQFTDAKLLEFAWLSKKADLLVAFNTVPRYLWSKVLGITVSVAWQSSQSIVYIKTQLRTSSQTRMTKKAGAGSVTGDSVFKSTAWTLAVSPSLFSLGNHIWKSETIVYLTRHKGTDARKGLGYVLLWGTEHNA